MFSVAEGDFGTGSRSSATLGNSPASTRGGGDPGRAGESVSVFVRESWVGVDQFLSIFRGIDEG